MNILFIEVKPEVLGRRKEAYCGVLIAFRLSLPPPTTVLLGRLSFSYTLYTYKYRMIVLLLFIINRRKSLGQFTYR